MVQAEDIQKLARLTADVAGAGQGLSLCRVRSHMCGGPSRLCAMEAEPGPPSKSKHSVSR